MGVGEQAGDGESEPWSAQLKRREIDCQGYSWRPTRGRAAGFLQHPVAEPADQPHFFGDRNEQARRDVAARRMAPADQRLETGDRSGFERDERLVLEGEIAVVESAS